MQIKKLIKEAHEMAVEKGFYDCLECGGSGFFGNTGSEEKSCLDCNGTGINPNKNIGELLMLIVSELGEALEAHRKNRFANESSLVNVSDYPEEHHRKEAIYLFEQNIKDTFEDAIADGFIRLFDLCGYLGIIPSPSIPDTFKYNTQNTGEILLRITDEIVAVNNSGCNGYNIARSIYYLWCAAVNNWHIPIEKHIIAKLAYSYRKTYNRKSVICRMIKKDYDNE